MVICKLRVYLVLGKITLSQLHSYILSNRRQDDFEEISFSWFGFHNSSPSGSHGGTPLGLFGMCGVYQRERVSIHLFDTCFPVIICQLEVLLNREDSNGKFQSKSNKVDRLYKRKLY